MKQLVQSMRTGAVKFSTCRRRGSSAPACSSARRPRSISAGTERAAMEFAKGSLLDKARCRPDLVKQVFRKCGATD